jgi:hypothetical protein
MKKILSLILVLLIPTQSFAAYTASAVMEMRSSGSSNLNSGVFDSGVAVPGTDYTLQDASQANGTDLASANGTTAPCTVTSAGYSFGTADEGNSIVISAGTNWTVSVYIITDTSGGGAILDKACGSAASISSGTWRMGGAYPGGNSTAGISDDARFELLDDGMKVWIKAGTYSLNEISLTTQAAVTDGISILGYNATRGDAPTGDDRPLLAGGANRFLLGPSGFRTENIRFTGTGTVVFSIGGNTSASVANNVKATNTSTTSARAGIQLGFVNRITNSEGISYRGNGFSVGSGGSGAIIGCWAHSSNNGISDTNGALTVINNIISDNVSNGFVATGSGQLTIANNTFIGGATSKRGDAIDVATPSSAYIANNIFSGFDVGITKTSEGTNPIGMQVDYNNFYNITTDVTNVTKGTGNIALDPTFTDVDEVNNEGTVTSGAADNIITDSTQDFTAEGVVAGRDYFYLVSGTNSTVGMYGITAVGTTTVTLDLDPSSSSTGSDIVYQIVRGQNFKVGTNLKAAGWPGSFQGGYTTGYLDIGAVQRQEPASGGSGGFFIQ